MLDRPTPQTYTELQQIFDHFNNRLFNGEIPSCLLTLQREKKTHGYFSFQRFVSKDGQTFTDEIALNPSYFSIVPPKEIMQTIVHEMVHAWQFHFGTPGRGRYHNKEWAEKMIEIGLMPSSTGQPGGATTGDSMSDYIIEGGAFEIACNEIIDKPNHFITWLDRFPPEPPSQGKGGRSMNEREPIKLADVLEEVIEYPLVVENKSNRVKLKCPNCGNQAWCKPEMKLLCGEDECNQAAMEEID